MGSGRSTAMLALVARVSLTSLRLAPSTARPMGPPPPSVSTLRCVPSVPRSVGCLPTVFPPKRGVGHGAIHGEPCPVHTLYGILVHEALPCSHKATKTAASVHA